MLNDFIPVPEVVYYLYYISRQFTKKTQLCFRLGLWVILTGGDVVLFQHEVGSRRGLGGQNKGKETGRDQQGPSTLTI